jgi:hypothetical protein
MQATGRFRDYSSWCSRQENGLDLHDMTVEQARRLLAALAAGRAHVVVDEDVRRVPGDDFGPDDPNPDPDCTKRGTGPTGASARPCGG